MFCLPDRAYKMASFVVYVYVDGLYLNAFAISWKRKDHTVNRTLFLDTNANLFYELWPVFKLPIATTMTQKVQQDGLLLFSFDKK